MTNTPGADLEKLRMAVFNCDHTMPDELDMLDHSELEQRILQSEWNLKENEGARRADPVRAAAKAAFEREDKPYRDADKLQKAIIKFCLARIEENGREAGQSNVVNTARATTVTLATVSDLDTTGTVNPAKSNVA